MSRIFVYEKGVGVVELGRKPSSGHVTQFFEPYYDRVLRSYVTSEHDKEKKMKKLKNYSHPQGLYNVRDDKKFMREMAHIQKNREMYKEATHPGYKARTRSEIEKQGERAYDKARPDMDRFSRRIYSYSR